MNKDEMIKNDRRKIMDLLYKLKNGELCTPNCYGCCGDNELSFAYCPDVTDNFEKELANLGYRKVEDDEIVESMKTYERARQETARKIAAKLKQHIAETRELYEAYIDVSYRGLTEQDIDDTLRGLGIELE